MRRIFRLGILYLVVLPLVPLLPAYLERTMVRSQVAGGGGDVIEWGSKLRTLYGFWSDYNYFRPEQKPFLWLTINILLALVYAALMALSVDRILVLASRRRRDASVKLDSE